ncbi:Lon protease [Bienertia sinuspersici]
MSLWGDAIRQAKAARPYRIRNAKAFPSKGFRSYRSGPGQLRSSILRVWEQLKQKKSGLNSGAARPSAAGLLPSSQLRKRARGKEQTKSGNGSLFTSQSLLNKARQGDPGRSAGFFPVVLFPPRERRTEEVCPARRRTVESFCCLDRELYDLFPYCIESIKKEPTKHFPAAPTARQAGGALVILTVFSAGAPSHCSSHKQWQLQLATTGACPLRPEWAQHSASIQITLGSLSLLPDLERYYESFVPDYIAAAIWFTGTTKKSHAYVTLIDGFLILDHEDYGRASGFYSHHHIDDKSPRALS